MSERKLPNIKAAQNLAKQHGLDGMIVIGFVDGKVSIASYGSTKQRCRELAKLVDFISEAIEREEVPLDSLENASQQLSIYEISG